MNRQNENWTPSKEEWNSLKESVQTLNIIVRRTEVALIGEVGSQNNEKCLNYILSKLATTVHGPQGESYKGLDQRMTVLEKDKVDRDLATASETGWRKGAIVVASAIGGLIGGLITWGLAIAGHFKKP